MTPPLPAVPVKPSEIEGLGVFANRPCTKGETILVFDGARLAIENHPIEPQAEHTENVRNKPAIPQPASFGR